MKNKMLNKLRNIEEFYFDIENEGDYISNIIVELDDKTQKEINEHLIEIEKDINDIYDVATSIDEETMIFNYDNFIEYLRNNNCLNDEILKNINDYMKFYNHFGE